jgi:hypothetical protein
MADKKIHMDNIHNLRILVDGEQYLSRTIFEEDGGAERSPILDMYGRPFCKEREQKRIGFIWRK